MDEFHEKKLKALEDQITLNGAAYRNLQSQHDLLNSKIHKLRDENLSLRTQLDKILQSKKWRLLTKFASFSSYANRLRKFIKF